MFKSINFTVIRCLDCSKVFKIEPNRPFESITCDCVKEPRAELKVVDTKKPKQNRSHNRNNKES